MNVQTVEPLLPESGRLARPFRGFLPRSFRTKFILVVGLAVLFTLSISVMIALWTVDRLARDAIARGRAGPDQRQPGISAQLHRHDGASHRADAGGGLRAGLLAGGLDADADRPPADDDGDRQGRRRRSLFRRYPAIRQHAAIGRRTRRARPRSSASGAISSGPTTSRCPRSSSRSTTPRSSISSASA